MKIYALDDASIFRTMYRSYLGADTYCTADGLLATMKMDRPDVFICDLVMPDMTGWEVIKRVQTMYPGLPIIVATTESEYVQREYAASQGCYFWYKGDSPSILKHIVAEVSECIQSKGK